MNSNQDVLAPDTENREKQVFFPLLALTFEDPVSFRSFSDSPAVCSDQG